VEVELAPRTQDIWLRRQRTFDSVVVKAAIRSLSCNHGNWLGYPEAALETTSFAASFWNNQERTLSWQA